MRKLEHRNRFWIAALLVISTASFGCVGTEGDSSSHGSEFAKGVVVRVNEIIAGGDKSVVVNIEIENLSRQAMCIVAKPGIQARIGVFERITGNRIDAGLSPDSFSGPPKPRITFDGPLIKIGGGQKYELSEVFGPINHPIIVGSDGVVLREVGLNDNASVRATVDLADCRFKTLMSAAEAHATKAVSSNFRPIPNDVSYY